jgi:acyl phosphate:glycerol-3-phosphate acyltransferase
MAWIEHLQSANWFQATGVTLGAYFLGCFAIGYYLVRTRTGKDVREIGSGSTGARNVGRVLGKPGYVLTAIGDIGKGALAVWAVQEWTRNPRLAALAVVGVVAGHLWPVQLRFRGGKGIATSFGALLMFDYRVALTILVVFLIGFAVMRKTLLPAMFVYAILPLVDWCYNRNDLTAALMTGLAAIILFAHWRNLAEEIAALPTRRGVASKPEHTKL